ncbi:PAP2 superfamily protein [Archangium gephyra]|uniref:PAP2 superfamily protein n=1 Tax=Archangium gephyra TaxID=48 RepID=A0AAC8QB61_9BACT|nr:phosphatase PAP2 family protein [Archangium gephyra]AKJ04462.1 Ser/Thr and Tyr protein phosphatase [Archangium gephyra]REG37466.1 PAP2 superfamily protein [Archangium gephyra]
MSPPRSNVSGPFPLYQDGRLSLSGVSEWLERRNKLVLAIAATLLHSLLYGIPNRIHLALPVELPMTWLDRVTPFIPLTFWLYLSDYALVFIAFMLCRRPGSAARFIYAFFTVVGVATLVHWVFPTVYPRALYPVPAEASPFMQWMVARFRELDSPASCLPSLHVATAFLSAFAVVAEADRRGPALVAWAAIVWGSTLTTKQHYLVDGATGLLLALAVWALYYARQPAGTRGG